MGPCSKGQGEGPHNFVSQIDRKGPAWPHLPVRDSRVCPPSQAGKPRFPPAVSLVRRLQDGPGEGARGSGSLADTVTHCPFMQMPCPGRPGLSSPPSRRLRLVSPKDVGRRQPRPHDSRAGQARGMLRGATRRHAEACRQVSRAEGWPLGGREHCVLVTMKSHFGKTVPVFSAVIPWLPLPCQGQNLGLSFQGRTKQFCFLGKWEVWDGERSLWRGDYHSWRHRLPSRILSPESGTEQHSVFPSSLWASLTGRF